MAIRTQIKWGCAIGLLGLCGYWGYLGYTLDRTIRSTLEDLPVWIHHGAVYVNRLTLSAEIEAVQIDPTILEALKKTSETHTKSFAEATGITGAFMDPTKIRIQLTPITHRISILSTQKNIACTLLLNQTNLYTLSINFNKKSGQWSEIASYTLGKNSVTESINNWTITTKWNDKIVQDFHFINSIGIINTPQSEGPKKTIHIVNDGSVIDNLDQSTQKDSMVMHSDGEFSISDMEKFKSIWSYLKTIQPSKKPDHGVIKEMLVQLSKLLTLNMSINDSQFGVFNLIYDAKSEINCTKYSLVFNQKSALNKKYIIKSIEKSDKSKKTQETILSVFPEILNIDIKNHIDFSVPNSWSKESGNTPICINHAFDWTIQSFRIQSTGQCDLPFDPNKVLDFKNSHFLGSITLTHGKNALNHILKTVIGEESVAPIIPIVYEGYNQLFKMDTKNSDIGTLTVEYNPPHGNDKDNSVYKNESLLSGIKINGLTLDKLSGVLSFLAGLPPFK